MDARTANKVLDKHDLNRYQRDGVLYPLHLLPETQVADCRTQFDQIEQAFSEPILRFDWAHLFFAWAFELSTRPALLDAVEALLGPDIVIWGSLITNKPARSDFHFAWHQDTAFCDFLGSVPAATAWIALTDSTSENGCLKVLPASHRSRLPHKTRSSDDNMLLQKQQVTDPIDLAETEDVLLKAGEMSIQHMALLHSSGANRSNLPRTGFVVRFATPDIKATRYPIIRARGSHACGHLSLWDSPPDNDVARGLRGRETLLAMHG